MSFSSELSDEDSSLMTSLVLGVFFNKVDTRNSLVDFLVLLLILSLVLVRMGSSVSTELLWALKSSKELEPELDRSPFIPNSSERASLGIISGFTLVDFIK